MIIITDSHTQINLWKNNIKEEETNISQEIKII
jgi:hypothetical protein